MFGTRSGGDQGDKFWRWIEANQSKIDAAIRVYRGGGAPPRIAVEELGQRLSRVQDGLVHEIGIDRDGNLELIISAEGIRELFPSVQRLVAQAPRLSRSR